LIVGNYQLRMALKHVAEEIAAGAEEDPVGFHLTILRGKRDVEELALFAHVHERGSHARMKFFPGQIEFVVARHSYHQDYASLPVYLTKIIINT
jgi:hypothetical protein